MSSKRPAFRKSKSIQFYASPEEMFSKLPNRSASHGYLRGPQVDVLREYMNLLNNRDIAFELPTGTGKTTVGLLIAEWRRRKSGEKVAFLTLTNQLAQQVLLEAEQLGLECANLIGDKQRRDPVEEGKYRSGNAVGISTYSNIFNVNPIVQASDILIFDDAHGGASVVSDMWTVRINIKRDNEIYNETIAVLRSAITDSQYRVITDESGFASYELVDMHNRLEVMSSLTGLLDSVKGSLRFPWSLIRNHLHACFCLVSSTEIIIRPLIPPTHSHLPFFDSTQRIYMSATLGGEGDLKKSYGITNLRSIHAQHAQWGKRYIFVPELTMSSENCSHLVAEVWNELKTRRGLLLAPSFAIAERTFSDVAGDMDPVPIRYVANDIEESLETFTSTENSILCLAGRYDGLDLPGDDCRLLLMSESPAAVGGIEKHLREHWRLGPLMRKRERTRLIQGMGRCTRDATDYAVIILIGQSLVDSVTTPALVKGLPGEIQKEIKWGISQGEVARDDVELLKEMIIGLLIDSDYRKEANENLEEIATPEIFSEPAEYEESGKFEVMYARTLWDGDSEKALEYIREAADHANSQELSGYRAWLWYLAGFAAANFGDRELEIDCFKRSKATGINTGFLAALIKSRTEDFCPIATEDMQSILAEAIWNRIGEWGWHGPKFFKFIKEMQTGLSNIDEPNQFHIGLELLGQCVGADTIRTSEVGAPDVVWIFPGEFYTFEAKSRKKTEGLLSKKNILQAKGHPDWVHSKRPEVIGCENRPFMVSPSAGLYEDAKPHIFGLYYISPIALQEYAKEVAKIITSLRSEFAGKDYAEIRDLFVAKVSKTSLSFIKIVETFSVSL